MDLKPSLKYVKCWILFSNYNNNFHKELVFAKHVPGTTTSAERLLVY